MSDLHVPVLLNEVVESFSIMKDRADLVFYDGTYGRGGHFREIIQKLKPAKAYLTDQDFAAIQLAQIEWKSEIEDGRIHFSHLNFADFSNLRSGRTIVKILRTIRRIITIPAIPNIFL